MVSNAASSSTSPARIFSKIRCAKISKECKQVIANVYVSTRTRFPEMSVREILERVSNDTGVCARTVAKYKAQCLYGKVASPKRRPRNVKVSSSQTVKHDEFTLNAIRLKVHRKYSEREIPTLDSILEAVNEDDELPDLSKTTLWRFLKDIGFTFEKRKRRLAPIERSDIIAWRRRYLRAIKEFRRQGRRSAEKTRVGARQSALSEAEAGLERRGRAAWPGPWRTRERSTSEVWSTTGGNSEPWPSGLGHDDPGVVLHRDSGSDGPRQPAYAALA
ncbi:hypothetical protein HPB47_003459 [Ixodes persulcatus]|uniref:Uncharacterized protein n=1 Tax=Ixodes persulcatus TaxID=34615 RepID=A0AC60PIG1_IXOPE|nr:hypothetical protein HPB47_003459 [Ixodes persulcatus]